MLRFQVLGLGFSNLYHNKISTIAREAYIVNEYLTRKLNKPHGVSSPHFHVEYMTNISLDWH